MTNKLSITLILIVGIILATLFLLTPSASALPTGYTYEELNCDINAGIPMTNIIIQTHTEAVGDFLSRHTKSTYSSTDNQGVQIGYTSKDASNEPYHFAYDLTQTYNEGNPTITASHYMETDGGTMSAEEAGISYDQIGSNSSNVVTPSSYRVRSDITSMMSGPSTFNADTYVTNSLTTDTQPTTFKMDAQLTGPDGEGLGDGSTFWNWEASYDHQLQNHLDNANFKNNTGNESFHTYEFGLTGGDHAVDYSIKANIGSKVSALLFDKKKPSSSGSSSTTETPLESIPEEPNTDVIAPLDDSQTYPVGIDQLNMPANEPTINATENTTANATVNATEELDLIGYNIANYNTANLHSS